MLFDTHDTQMARNQRHLVYHYYEWFAAIMLYKHHRPFKPC